MTSPDQTSPKYKNKASQLNIDEQIQHANRYSSKSMDKLTNHRLKITRDWTMVGLGSLDRRVI
jgi:hypothetical protein